MRIVTWNVNHRTFQRKIPPQMAQALMSLDPDVAVLTEWVPGESRSGFRADLAGYGLAHQLSSVYVKRENSVLIASRSPLETGKIFAPPIAPSVPPNALHVKLTEYDLDMLGLRVPDYSRKPAIRRKCWDWLMEAAKSLVGNSSIIIGDLNTDPDHPAARCGDQLGLLASNGWYHALPVDGASYWTPKGKPCRLDHAFVSRRLRVHCSQYISENDRYIFAREAHDGLSDHAVLAIDLDLPAVSSQ